jgi:hypothetical protein
MAIKIARDFSRVPAGRYHPVDGNRTGERFRNEFLVKYLDESSDVIEIDLDGAVGYPSSFLEEAFGGLVRMGYAVDVLRSRLKIVASEARKRRHIQQIWDYIQEAKEAAVA